jgi:hypothetical protein
MSPEDRDSEQFVRALVRSACADGPPPGAMARAGVRLGVGEVAPGVPSWLAAAILTAAVIFGVGWCPNVDFGGAGSVVTATDCWVGVEAPPCSGSASMNAGPAVAATGSSSGADPSRGSSGG